MDFSELTKIAVDRIQNHEPENFRKIMGFILLNEPSETEMINLAYGPETTLLSRIDEINLMLRRLSPQNDSLPKNPVSFSSSSAFHVPDDYWEHQLASDKLPPCQAIDFAPRTYSNSGEESFSISQSIPLKTNKRSPSLPEMPIRACHYYYKGYCKHGTNCRYFHGNSPFSDAFSPAFSPCANEMQNEEPVFSPGSLAKLEIEIAELLRPLRGAPVSIALLPMLYYEKYGRSLQAEGYLTESQRNGKAGFSLTKLLARLNNTVRLIDRPHGQHSVILQEDVPKYLNCSNEKPDVLAPSSHQIYLTFPAESAFTEDDVSNYFKQFGPVKDVRIPCQEKRMFGFVSFFYPETVIEILMKRVPHYICGARVLVKPYREKSRLIDRMYSEKINSGMHYPDLDCELQMLPRDLENSRGLKLHFEEKEMLLELERAHLSEFGLAHKPLNKRLNFIHGADNLKLIVPDDFSFEDYFSSTLEALNGGLSTDNKARRSGNSYSDMGRAHIELPENPFAYQPPLGSSIPAAI